jgi:hypothetical protein
MGTLFAGLALMSPQAGEIFKTCVTIGIFLANLWLFGYMGHMLYKELKAKASVSTKKGLKNANEFAQRISKKLRLTMSKSFK